MSTSFWLLDPPANQRRATLVPDTKHEQLVCSSDDGHNRGGRRLGDLSVTIDPSGIKDFTWTWRSDLLVSRRVLDLFEKYRVTGFETRPVTISYVKPSQAPPPEMFEIVVTGWAGMAAPAAGVTLVESCPACAYKTYSIAEPRRLIDPATWDGSDLFIVWPLPLYRFISNRLADILRQERIAGVKLAASSEIPMKKGTLATPGRLTSWMPEKRAHELGDSLGIA